MKGRVAIPRRLYMVEEHPVGSLIQFKTKTKTKTNKQKKTHAKSHDVYPCSGTSCGPARWKGTFQGKGHRVLVDKLNISCQYQLAAEDNSIVG